MISYRQRCLQDSPHCPWCAKYHGTYLLILSLAPSFKHIFLLLPYVFYLPKIEIIFQSHYASSLPPCSTLVHLQHPQEGSSKAHSPEFLPQDTPSHRIIRLDTKLLQCVGRLIKIIRLYPYIYNIQRKLYILCHTIYLFIHTYLSLP